MTTALELHVFVRGAMSIVEHMNIALSADARFIVLSRNLEQAMARELNVDAISVVSAFMKLDDSYEFGDNVDQAYRELRDYCDGWLGHYSLDESMKSSGSKEILP